MEQKEHKDYWSECGQVFFHHGYGWGLTENLQSICLGEEADIKKAFETGEMRDDLSPVHRQTLTGILEYRKEQGIGTRETDLVRASNDGAIGGKQKAVGTTKKGKRLALRASHKKHNYILWR